MNVLRSQPVRLTAEICALVDRTRFASGPSDQEPSREADYHLLVERVLAAGPSSDDAWVFTDDPLMGRSLSVTAESRVVALKGWHRSFCLRSTRCWGTSDRPGLSMALMRGGQCQALALRLPRETAARDLRPLFRRALGAAPFKRLPRWLTAASNEGSIRALVFTANPVGRSFAGKMPLEQVAAVLTDAGGVRGSAVERLYETVARLEELGIRDGALWKLQTMVAQNILAKAQAQPFTASR